MHFIMKYLWSLIVYLGPTWLNNAVMNWTKFEGAKVTCVETVFKIHISDFFKQNNDFDAQSLLYLLTVLRSLRNIELLYEDRCLKMQPPAIGSFD